MKAKVYKAGKVIVKEAPPPPPEPEKEAWSLEQSIWAPRKKWCDALDFWDTDEVERKKFEWIWQTSRQEQGLDKLIMLHDDAGGVDEDGDGTPDEIEEVGDVLWDLHDLIFCAYDYYCGCGKNIQSMALNQWTDFIEDCKLVDRKSKFCKKADIDRLFITVDSRMGKPSKQLSRIEFLAALVHLGINSASDGGEVGQKHMASLCSFSEWQMFVKLCKLIGPDLTERDAKLSFAWARMAVINGASEQGAVKESNLPFEGFLEACCRLAVLKSLPTDAEIEASSSADAGLHIRHLIATDEVAYNELVASRSSPWPGSFREPKQEPARKVA
ncbi:flagellar associated protein [Chrysochromulina tobinii]|uniref:Flagellar associated protein n=1 Tax=Chrysochromulina tobinii TaxID=1460289 RepID=A0A0M0K271_9EUKA|nr:flagellar associated protein [Chrysochromulina tobinii]|eukprot:KOO32951.1 flagellar associated protein [Chrysochromulina sp. CCMP291]